MKYIKKPIVVEAMQWDGTKESADKIKEWDTNAWDLIDEKDGSLHFFVGNCFKCHPTDFVIRDIEGDCYPCKDSVFKKTYEKVV